MLAKRLLPSLMLLLASPAFADTIAIIGTGKVGAAIGGVFAEQGHTIIYGSRSPSGLKTLELASKTGDGAKTAKPDEAAAAADIVVLAVPGMVALDVAKGLGDLNGKIVIDVTNPLVVEPPLTFTFGVAGSNGEMIQAALPDAHVVKALNTINWQSMIDPGTSAGPLSVPLSGDDEASKREVAAMVTAMGLHPIDIGDIETSHWTEYGVVIMLNNQFSERVGYEMHLREVAAE
ncbi:MAG: NAD(P)-binding domain-containing protein [Gammaproteobacteria bacterium]|nr:NAD(P)-binding domain-containing protein [Gammaproteobacteria bacterium]